MSYVLIAYYSASQQVEKMAGHVARGLHANRVNYLLKPIKPLRQVESEVSYVSIDDLKDCSGLILGSPTRFGQPAAAVSHLWDQTAGIWMQQSLMGKPAAVFTSSSTEVAGQSTLLSLAIPLLHHGMMVMGMVGDDQSPYGAYSSEGQVNNGADRAFELGQKMAEITNKLNK
ncbi:NAD(P)H-dependent oxidoreductase [Gammaproteobacteria bacterium]|nr:NAD(P)H-dependent oxidoreductase [Gammaproteobacteria bacterium]